MSCSILNAFFLTRNNNRVIVHTVTERSNDLHGMRKLTHSLEHEALGTQKTRQIAWSKAKRHEEKRNMLFDVKM